MFKVALLWCSCRVPVLQRLFNAPALIASFRLLICLALILVGERGGVAVSGVTHNGYCWDHYKRDRQLSLLVRFE